MPTQEVMGLPLACFHPSIYVYTQDNAISIKSPQGDHALAADLWTSHGHKIVKEIHPKYLDPDKMEDRRVWAEVKCKK